MSFASKQQGKLPPVPIRDVLIHYGATDLPLGHRGWLPVRCNFHSDSQASASFSEQLEAFSCHGCEMRGDGLAIIMKVENVGFPEAAILAREISPGWLGDGVPQSVDEPRRARPLSLFDGGSRPESGNPQAVPNRNRTRARRIS